MLSIGGFSTEKRFTYKNACGIILLRMGRGFLSENQTERSLSL